jgi:hypothetical protein
MTVISMRESINTALTLGHTETSSVLAAQASMQAVNVAGAIPSASAG